MADLLSLPNELISKISDQLDTRKAFRGTCKRIDLITSHRLLSYIIIDVNERRRDLSISQLEALVNRSTRAAEYVHTVEIRVLVHNYDPISKTYFSHPRGFRGDSLPLIEPSHPDVDVDWVDKRICELLPLALSTLAGAQNIVWAINDKDPSWVSPTVSEFLATLPSLRTLHLASSGIDGYNFHLNYVSNLSKLTVRGCLNTIPEIIGASPGLTYLDVEYIGHRTERATPTFHELLSKVPHNHLLELHHLRIHHCHVLLDRGVISHLRALESLDLKIAAIYPDSGEFSSPLANVWGTIRREALPIKAINTPVNDAVLDHLVAMSGIRILGLNWGHFDWTESHSTPVFSSREFLVHKFFTQVLPRHRQTLVSLSIPPGFGSHWWCLGPHNIDHLLQCSYLTELFIVMDVSSSPRVQARATPNGVVAEILRIAARLPNLRSLTFDITDMEPRHQRRWGQGPRFPSLPKLPDAVVRSLTSFGPVDLDIHPQKIYYRGQELQPCLRLDGVATYVQCPISPHFPRVL